MHSFSGLEECGLSGVTWIISSVRAHMNVFLQVKLVTHATQSHFSFDIVASFLWRYPRSNASKRHYVIRRTPYGDLINVCHYCSWLKPGTISYANSLRVLYGLYLELLDDL